MRMMSFILTALLLPAMNAAASTVLYPAPAGAVLSADYAVKVNGQSVSVYRFLYHNQPYSFAYFDFSGTVNVDVTVASPWMRTPIIRPTSKGITYTLNNKTISFSLSNPANISVEPDSGGIIDATPLILFANPLEVNAPTPSTPGVIYYGPGYHNAGRITLGSNSTLYIAGGAVVTGYITAGGSNIKITGRGIFDALGKYGDYEVTGAHRLLQLRNCTNFSIDGVILKDSGIWTFYILDSSYVTASNLKIISTVGPMYHDGIDIDNSNHVTIQDSFVLSDDDSFQIGGQFNGAAADTVNVARSVLWSSGANNWRIGWVAQAPYISNLTFTDIDVLHRGSFNRVVTMQESGTGTVGTPLTNVRFENIRIEADYGWTGDFIELQPQVWGTDGALGPPGTIQNVYFKDIFLSGYKNPATAGTIVVQGPSAAAYVKDVTFENVVRYGQATAANSANVSVGANTSNIVFTGSAGSTPPPPPPQPPPSGGLPDVIITALTYANGAYTAAVKNQGAVATPVGVNIGVGFSVDGQYQAGAYVSGPLAVGASVDVAASGGIIANGTHTLLATADDVNRFSESDETNNQFSKTISIGVATDATAPGVPANLSAQAASSSQINLTWAASTDNVGVTGYKVFRAGTQIAVTAGTTYSDTGLSASTAYSYTVAAYDATGNASAQSPAASATTQAPLSTLTCPGPGNGTFSACYFNNMTLDAAGLALTRSEAAVNSDWGAGAPDASVNADNFSARWQGNFAFNAGDYTFTMTVDDGGRLYVDGVLVIDQWINQAATTYTVTRAMTAGTHLIKMEYYENGGGATAKLSWLQAGAPPVATDLNGDGVSNVTDVQLGVNQALGLSVCAAGDVNKDGACNVTDVQRIVNAALGL